MGEIQNEWLQELYKVSLGRLGLTLMINSSLTVCRQFDGVNKKKKRIITMVTFQYTHKLHVSLENRYCEDDWQCTVTISCQEQEFTL